MDPASIFTAEIVQEDALKIDNSAVATLRPDRKIEVLVVSDGSEALNTILNTGTVKTVANASFIDTVAYTKWAEEGFVTSSDPGSPLSFQFDLVIFDSVTLTKLPPANTLVFGGSMPDGQGWKYGPMAGPVIIVDWDRAHPIMQFLTLSSLRIVQGRSVEGPEGSKVLMRGDNGALLTLAPRGAFQDVVVGFGLKEQVEGQTITNTDWPIRPSFAVFTLALLENVGGATAQRDNLSVRPGEPAVLSVPPRINRFIVTDPQGKAQVVERDNAGQVVWTDTDVPGLYKIAAADNAAVPLDAFVVNLLSC